MTREQIEEWMRLSGADFPHIASLNRDLFPVFARFAEYATKHEANRIADESKHIIKRAEKRGAEIEREACAKVCDSLHDKIELVEKTEHYPGEYGSEYDAGQGNAICECADAIRARGEISEEE